MRAAIRHITVDCRDPYGLAQFWAQVFGVPPDPDNRPDAEAAVVELDEQPGLLFMRVPEPKSDKNRWHLDLQPAGPRDADVERLVALGATPRHDRRNPDGSGWVVLADPEGNEFCVERSPAERAAAP